MSSSERPDSSFSSAHTTKTYLVSVQNVAKGAAKGLRDGVPLCDYSSYCRRTGSNHALAGSIEGVLGLGLVVVGLQVLLGMNVRNAAVHCIINNISFVTVVPLQGIVVKFLVEGRGDSSYGFSGTGGGRRSDALADLVA
jgi:hypothetical protein